MNERRTPSPAMRSRESSESRRPLSPAARGPSLAKLPEDLEQEPLTGPNASALLETTGGPEADSCASTTSSKELSALSPRAASGWRTLNIDELKRVKEQEEARVLMDLEIHADDTAVDDGLKQTEADESADEATAFGLPHVAVTSATESVLQHVASMVMSAFVRRKRKPRVRPADLEAKGDGAETKRSWAAARDVVWQLAVLLDAIYVLVSVPFRIGFLFDPWDDRLYAHGGQWSRDLVVLSTLDVAGELCRWRSTWNILHAIYKRRRTRHVAPNGMPRRFSTANPVLAARPLPPSVFSVKTERSHREREPERDREPKSSDATLSFEGMSATSRSEKSTPSVVTIVLGIVPFELFAVAMNTNWIHIARIGKLVLVWHTLVSSYSALLLACQRFAWVQRLSFSTLAMPFYPFWLGLYLCHLAACGYILIANIECGLHSQFCMKTPLPGSWVLKDNMEQASLWRRYVRTMYWASKTVTTLGQGDLVPTTLAETHYCIIVQFISGLWATAFLASSTFYFSRIDRNIESSVSTRLEQALQFLKARDVPSTLSTQIRNYYQHVQRTRNGVEEEQVLANLPEHYQFQCAFFVKYRLLAKVPFFTKQPKAFLRTVVNALAGDFLSPKDVVVALYDLEELVIVSYGNIFVFNSQKELVKVLSQEEWFAEDAIFDDRRSQCQLEAKTSCEIFRLSHRVFISCMEKHFAKPRIAALVAQQKQRSAISSALGLQPIRPTTTVSNGRFAGNGLLKRFSKRGEFESIPWMSPGSRFRKRWRRWKVLFLLFLAIEVPYEIAFKWRRGLFGKDVTISQQAVYLMSFASEIFFYVDWFLRAFKFSRRSRNRESIPTNPHAGKDSAPEKPTRNESEISATPRRDDLVTMSRALWKLYISSDDVLFDVISISPISVVWDIVNNSSYNIALREVMRFARLLALCRLFSLKRLMKKIMVAFDFSPASRLLTNVIVFCIITANGMACFFYLLADDKDFLDAQPIGFEDSSSITSQLCLEQASLFGNCTWFMYDRSTFMIQARYIRSLHWSLVLLSTVGYGDIVSFTNSECLIGFWWIYLGALICYFTSCAVGSVISHVTVLQSAKDHRVEEITRALVRSNVSRSTRVMLRSYYDAN